VGQPHRREIRGPKQQFRTYAGDGDLRGSNTGRVGDPKIVETILIETGTKDELVGRTGWKMPSYRRMPRSAEIVPAAKFSPSETDGGRKIVGDNGHNVRIGCHFTQFSGAGAQRSRKVRVASMEHFSAIGREAPSAANMAAVQRPSGPSCGLVMTFTTGTQGLALPKWVG
jgi:hypothetical protein